MSWTTWREAIGVVRYRRNLRRTSTLALVIGSTFVALNQSAAILAGQVDATVAARILVTYLVPFCVSNYSILMATRRPATLV